MTKEYLKMADGFKCGAKWFGDALREETGAADELINSAVHAINSHDELVAEVERLRAALQQCQIALLIADRFCGNHTADDCGDDVAIPIRDALIAATKNLA